MSHERKDGKVHLKDEARTPPGLFRRLNERFHFDIDAACTVDNCLCRFGFASDFQEGNTLKIDWCNPPDFKSFPTIYCNPPYSNPAPFVEKAYMESLKGAIVVMLLPADVSTSWFHLYCMEAAEWIIIDGRVRFNNPDGTPMQGSPKFGSIVVVFDMEARNKHGLVVSEMDWR